MRFVKPLSAIAALGVLLLASSAAPAAPPSRGAGTFTDARRALHAAVSHGSPEEMLKARARLAAMSAAEPRSAEKNYWVALADWRLAPRLVGQDKVQAERLCREGLDRLDAVLKLEPRNAEAIALKANLQGISLMFRPNEMMTIGMEMEAAMGRAVDLAPHNPRVLFLSALSTLNKPAFVGGGPERALEAFKKAQAAFAAEASDTTGAAWGRDDAFLWAGRTAMKLGDYPAAAGYFRQALEVTPDHAWVRNTLLPEAEKAVAAADSASTR